jgi:histidine triad (HIT) family protein
MNDNQIIDEYIRQGGSDVYCDLIIPKKIKSSLLYENEYILVRKHTRPLARYHYVVIPKRHILDISKPEFAKISLEIWKGVNKALSKIPYEEVGARVVTNLGKYQESKHLHVHVFGGKHINSNPIGVK